MSVTRTGARLHTDRLATGAARRVRCSDRVQTEPVVRVELVVIDEAKRPKWRVTCRCGYVSKFFIHPSTAKRFQRGHAAAHSSVDAHGR